MYEDKTEMYESRHALLEECRASKGDRLAAGIAAKRLTIFMQSIDFGKLVSLSRQILKQAEVLKQMTEQLQSDSADHHRKNLKKTKELVSDTVSDMSDSITEYIGEFYREGGSDG